jgi:hypothetical protein
LSAEGIITSTWDRHAEEALSEFAKKGEGGWEWHITPPPEPPGVHDPYDEHSRIAVRGVEKITYRFVHTGTSAKKLGQSRTKPRRFAKRAYEVRGTWKGVTVVVERFER